jgi:hypothetical protein
MRRRSFVIRGIWYEAREGVLVAEIFSNVFLDSFWIALVAFLSHLKLFLKCNLHAQN